MNVRACAFVVASIIATPVFATPITTISVTSTVPSPTVGEVFDVNVSIANAVNLITFGFDLTFDSSIVTPVGEPTLGPFLEHDGGTADFFPGLSDPGSLSFIFATLADGGTASDAGILATIGFRAIAPGFSALTLDQIVLVDNTSDPLFPQNIEFGSEDGGVTVAASTDVTPVPEPATLALLGSGLAAAWRKHRRRILK